MKRIFSIVMMSVALVAAASTLTGCKETQGIVWNVEAQTSGEGKITVTYPTGNPGLVVEGNATATASTTNDTTAAKFMVPNGSLLASDVLANPVAYSKQEVKDAEYLMSEISDKVVDFKAEGTWKASVTGYAKYGQMYFVIDEHWPVDTTNVQ